MKRVIPIAFVLTLAMSLAIISIPKVYAYNVENYSTVCNHNYFGEGTEYDQYTGTGVTGRGWTNDTTRWYEGDWIMERGYNVNNPYYWFGPLFSYWKIGGSTYSSTSSYRNDYGQNIRENFHTYGSVNSNFVAGKADSYFNRPLATPPQYWVIYGAWANLYR